MLSPALEYLRTVGRYTLAGYSTHRPQWECTPVARLTGAGMHVLAVDGTLRPRAGPPDQGFFVMVRGKFPPILTLLKMKWQATMPMENDQTVNFMTCVARFQT